MEFLSTDLDITHFSTNFVFEDGGQVINIYGHGFPFNQCNLCLNEYITVFIGNA